MISSIALVPYWLADSPHQIVLSDHYWWFQHLHEYSVVIYVGPYIASGMSQHAGKKIICIKTTSLVFDLQEIFLDGLYSYGIVPQDITLYWHVIEASATCRVSNTSILNCPKVCVIGDTHHMHKPITSLYPYLRTETFTHNCCSHNQYNPFFEVYLGTDSIDFPFVLPPVGSADTYSDRSEFCSTSSLYYYGSTRSVHHIHRSRIVNLLLLRAEMANRLIICPRQTFGQWQKAIQRRHHNLTCSLNGTFSFQTFLPMLGGACLYTDRISKANWVGSIMVDGANCVIYSTAEQLLERYLYLMQTPSEAYSISHNARISLQPFLRDTYTLQKLWTAGPPRDRVLSTSEELSLRSLLSSHLQTYGHDDLVRCVEIFESVQEAHRCFSKVTVKIFTSNQYGRDAFDRQNSILEIIETSCRLLPRCKTIRMQAYDLSSSLPPRPLQLDITANEADIIEQIYF